MSLQRTTTVQTVSVTAALATTEEIRWSNGAFGMIHIPTGSSITSLTWYDAPEYGGTYLPSNDEDVAAVTQTVSGGNSYQIPLAISGAVAVKIVGNAAGTVTIVKKG